LRSPGIDYKLFAFNFYGHALEPIKEQFIAQVKDGLRRNVFVIDMAEEQRLYEEERAKGSLYDTLSEKGKKGKSFIVIMAILSDSLLQYQEDRPRLNLVGNLVYCKLL